MRQTSLGMRARPIGDELILTTFQDVDFAFRSPAFDNGQELDGHRVPAAQGRVNAPLLGDTLPALDGDEHFERRRIEAELFRTPTLAHYEAHRAEPAVRSALDRIRRRSGSERTPRAELLGLTRNILTAITAALVGLDGLDDPEESERIVTLLADIADGATAIHQPDREVAVQRGLVARSVITDVYLRPSLRRRRERLRRGDTGDGPADLLTLFLCHEEHFGKWDDDLILREVALYLRGSSHTTSNGIAHTVDELETWLADRGADRAVLTDLDFLRRAFDEALRLNPSTPTQWMVTTQPVTTPGGIDLEPGQLIGVSFVDANRDPLVFGPDADLFDPDRPVRTGIRRHGLAFGGGSHACIGKPLVLGERHSGGGGRHGTAAMLLDAFYRAGMRPDPDRPPRPHRGIVGHYETFPVVFDLR